MCRFSILDFLPATDLETGPDSGLVKPEFESGEHEDIGNSVWLKFDTETILGKDFEFKVGKIPLTYGLIVALAGDFYGNYTALLGDVEQISDKWDTNPDSSIAIGLKVAKWLSDDTEKYLAAVLKTMNKEKGEVFDRLKKGAEDVAQIFASFGDKYDKQYNNDTRKPWSPVGAYAWIALCNWDHFGQGAYNAYSALHTAALRKSKEAHDGDQAKADETMVQAYFLEGYAQHFLTDLFSSGHLRTPRRRLHWNLVKNTTIAESLYPADSCAQKMHNEDCANGLWVRNRRGDAWAAYGDKQLWGAKSTQNFVQAVKAAQAGADEVRKTRETGIIPAAKDFSALQLTPILDGLDFSNYPPLFKSQDASSALLYRANIDNRTEFTFSPMSPKPSRTEWLNLLKRIGESGADKNMYPFSKGFLSETSFVHLRQAPDSSSLIDSRYGPLDPGVYRPTWTMVAQSNPPLATGQSTIEWVHATSVSPDVRSVVGRSKVAQGWRYCHLGIAKKATIWNDETDVGAADYILRDVAYGNYSSDQAAGKIGMLRSFDGANGKEGKVDVWRLDGSFTEAPSKVGMDWSTVSLRFTLSHQVEANDSFKTFVGLGQGDKWYFSTWTNEYRTQNLTALDYAVDVDVQALFSVDWTSLSPDKGHRLMAISFNPQNAIRITVLNPTRNTKGKVEMGVPSGTTVPISWGVPSPDKYLTWFFAESKLVTLVVTADSSLMVVAFPFAYPDQWGAPVVSRIGLKPGQGSLLTAAFMTPLRTMQAGYTYPEVDGEKAAVTTDAGIIMFFDNYGVLGVRMVAPVTKGSAAYEIKGQTPAISGQPAKTLGGSRLQTIGIFPQDINIL